MFFISFDYWHPIFRYVLIQYFNSSAIRENSNQPQYFTNSSSGGNNKSNFPQQNGALNQKKIAIDIEGAVVHPGVYLWH